VRLKIISVGRERADPTAPLIRDYEGRLSKFLPIENTVLKNERADKLKNRVFKELDNCQRVVGLDEKGRQMGSCQFAALVAKWMDTGVAKVAFVIGGAEGLLPEIKARTHMLLALSEMTFPHRLARLLLVEQLYRALTIIKNTPYQK
jgi:23S rRNA (pseudouridine1915-N3)-methyltransferase